MSPRALVAVAAAGSATTATVVLSVPAIETSYRSTETHIALETAEGVAGVVLVVLVFGRFFVRGATRDLLVAYGFGLFMSANLFLSVVPAAVTGGRDTAVGTWGPAAARLTGALVLTIGALSIGGTMDAERRRRAGTWAAATVLVVIGLIAGTIGGLGDDLPSAVRVTDPVDADASLEPHPVIVGLQLVAAVLFLLATVGFVRRAERDGDELFGWLAAGAAVSVVARVTYLAVPSLYTDYVHIGDYLRLASYAFYLTGGVREIARYWRSVAHAAVVDDRRRMARDLHDGLAQELAFIARQARLVATEPSGPALEPVIAAADRALDESRAAIHALTMADDEPLDVVIAAAAGEVAARLGVDVDLHLEQDIHVTLAVQEALARVVREGVSNAARHGGPSSIGVRLSSGPPITVVIEDDGQGFDVGVPTRPGAHGLVSMRERIAAIGGVVTIDSGAGRGTRVEVWLP